MTSVLGYARTYFVGGSFRPADLPTLHEEVERLHGMLADLGRHIESGSPGAVGHWSWASGPGG